MTEVVKLKVAPKWSDDEQTMEKYDTMQKEFREWLVDHPNSGFVMVAYHRKSDGGMSSIANYRIADPMDAYVLPDFVKGRIIDVRNDAKEPE